MDQYESKLHKALRHLEGRGISVGQPIVGAQGFVFDVMGFMLNVAQINDLLDLGKLNERGILEFAKSVENDPMAARTLPSDVLADD